MSAIETVRVELTNHELIILDGKVSEKSQKAVDTAKARIAEHEQHPELTEAQAYFISDLVREAEKNGILIFRHTQIHSCTVCGQRGGYAKHKRTTRYHVRGDSNYNKPTYLSGYEFAKRFVTMQGHATLGCCADCFNDMHDAIASRLKNVRAQISESILGFDNGLRRVELRQCSECGWEGPESKMGLLDALFGGQYPGECPNCHVQDRPLGPMKIKISDGFVVEESA